MPTYGDTPGIGGQGTYADPILLPGSTVNVISSPMLGLAARVHRQSASNQQIVGELWYQDRSNGNWYLFPIQPAMSPIHHPTIERQYHNPPTFSAQIHDGFGLLTPENLNSSYNYNHAAALDPIMDEARPVLWRAGTFCYYNLCAAIAPTSTLAPTVGTLASLTDGVLGNIATAVTGYAQFSLTGASSISITVDLGTVQPIEHAVIRFATKSGVCTLPASVSYMFSPDGVNWVTFPTRPIGGPGGDWAEDYNGRTIEATRADVQMAARYVRFGITSTGTQTIAVDEVAVYGGLPGSYVGKNLFFGYLGDALQFTPEGLCSFRATGGEKKYQDNNEVRVTAAFGTRGVGVEIGDIAWSLLTSPMYWPGGTGTAYDAATPYANVGWGNGSALTGLIMPKWQGQNNSLWGYMQDLFHEVGWLVYIDGNGVVQALQPPYRQILPSRICIAAPDGNDDVWGCVRDRSGKDLRNVVDMQSSATAGAGVRSVISEPNSVGRFGHRRMVITDPVATQRDIQGKIAAKILRDYAWRLQTLKNAFAPNFDTNLKDTFGFRAPARPNLFPAASSVAGDLRQRELWALESYTEHFMQGKWEATAEFIPYVPSGPDAPALLSITPGTGAASNQITVAWTPISDPSVLTVSIYTSATNDTTGFTRAAAGITPGGSGNYVVSPFTSGTQYWIYVTCTDRDGQESLPSTVLSAIAGVQGASSSDWAVTNLSAAYNPPTVGPDGAGRYSYELALAWTAPPAGYKRMEMYYKVGSLPVNQTSTNSADGWTYQDEFHGAYVAAGTALGWNARIVSPTALVSGTKIWFRMLTTSRNSSDSGGWYWSSEAFATIP